MLRLVFSCLVVFSFFPSLLFADETVVPLDDPDAAKQWKFTEKTGSLQNGELVFDGMNGISKGFYLPLEWNDVTLSAKFMVEPGPSDKVLVCGFIVRAVNASRYYYAHLSPGRRSAILVRSGEGNEWTEITRVDVPNLETGKWHDAALEIRGDTLTVFIDGKKLYDAKDAAIQGAGRIGFYASEGVAHVKDIRIGGVAQPTTAELKIPGPSWVYVCTSTERGEYEAFPDVCRLQDGRLLCVFYAGYWHVSLPNEQLPLGGYIAACYSSDEGKTWTAAETIIDTPLDDRDSSVVQLADGRILCTFFTYQGTGSKEEYGEWTIHTPTGPKTYLAPKHGKSDVAIVESADNGKTWSQPRFLFQDSPVQVAVSQPIRVLSDGTLLLPLYTHDAKNPGSASGAVSLSDDQGKTWSDIIIIPNGGRQLDAETDVLELKDGTLYAIQRSETDSMGFSHSKDKGKTWSVSEKVGFPGHCPYLLRTRDDVILLATRIPATSLRISRDECKTWSEPIPVDHYGGAYPSMVELKDGSILIVYYEEGYNSNIRAKKFRVTDTGVEWLPFE